MVEPWHKVVGPPVIAVNTGVVYTLIGIVFDVAETWLQPVLSRSTTQYTLLPLVSDPMEMLVLPLPARVPFLYQL